MRALESKVPPVAAAFLAALLMWLVSRALPAFAFEFPWCEVVAIGLGTVGVVISSLGVLSFRRAGTTVNPIKPGSTTSLVASGVYGMSRNPMYLGFLLLLAAWAVFLSSAPAFLLLPAFAIFIDRFQIVPEERALSAIFGPDFVAYKARVRRWV